MIICPFRHKKKNNHDHYLNFNFKILVNYLGQACILSLAFGWFSSHQAELTPGQENILEIFTQTLFILDALFPTPVFGVSCQEKIHFQLEIHL